MNNEIVEKLCALVEKDAEAWSNPEITSTLPMLYVMQRGVVREYSGMVNVADHYAVFAHFLHMNDGSLVFDGCTVYGMEHDLGISPKDWCSMREEVAQWIANNTDIVEHTKNGILARIQQVAA